jgi:hypothetical protein
MVAGIEIRGEQELAQHEQQTTLPRHFRDEQYLEKLEKRVHNMRMRTKPVDDRLHRPTNEKLSRDVRNGIGNLQWSSRRGAFVLEIFLQPHAKSPRDRFELAGLFEEMTERGQVSVHALTKFCGLPITPTLSEVGLEHPLQSVCPIARRFPETAPQELQLLHQFRIIADCRQALVPSNERSDERDSFPKNQDSAFGCSADRRRRAGGTRS